MGQIFHKHSDFQLLAGSGSFFLPALTVGAVGGVMALAAVAPHSLAEIVESFQNGDMKRARDIQLGIISANAAVTARFGIAGLKAALDMIGMYGGPVRPPLLPLGKEQMATLEKILKEAGILEGVE
jgi:4-hydroxy-2-oxoglutarate aldolase